MSNGMGVDNFVMTDDTACALDTVLSASIDANIRACIPGISE